MSAQPHVLVVDDDPDMLAVATSALEQAGYRVTSAPSGKEGVEQLRHERPDVILFDFWMPEMRGDARNRQNRKPLLLPVSAQE